MERELWMQLYVVLVKLDKRLWAGFFRSSEIVAVFLWAVVHDRPTSWACERRNWGNLVPLYLPSQSTMSRRLRTAAVRDLLARVEAQLGGDPRRWWLQRIDSKPLPVGMYSKDIEATWGFSAKKLARGYKLHAVWGGGPLPSVWQIESMNVSDARAGIELVSRLPGEGYIVGDKKYDSSRIHEVASPRHQLVAPQSRPGKALGHRRHHPGRLRSLELEQRPFGQALIHCRGQIERDFGHLSSFAAGLSPLPSWVRRPHRVRLWVQAKLIINALQLLISKKPLTATA
jgi:hypothetical protein